MGQIAFKLLMAEINNKDAKNSNASLSSAKFVTLPTKLRKRKSVKYFKSKKNVDKIILQSQD